MAKLEGSRWLANLGGLVSKLGGWVAKERKIGG